MQKKIKKIKVLVLDVDGVLTDGKIIVDTEGREIKVFDVQDGFGIVFFQKMGFKTAILTARKSKAVSVRAKDLKIHKVYQDAYPKIKAYEKILREFKVKDQDVCFIGDDLTDLQVMKRVGFSVAVSNAVSEIKKVSDYVTKKHGGQGAVREVIELILKAQGKWSLALKRIGS